MNAKALIRKKRDRGTLDEAEIRFFVDGAVAGKIERYQVTAFLMAVFFAGMTPEETAFLTRAMLDSGESLVLPGFNLQPTDKHSTGGVGDKISFLVAPLVAAAGVPVPMISGRSLGHTGGTLDKLESIPGFRTDLSTEEMLGQLERIGVFITGQTETLVPADRLFYALRDAASIVESVPLITGSILSKKAAAGVRGLALDVKVGAGAFMPDRERGRELATTLVSVAGLLGIRARAHLTGMDHVLGRTAGNAIEIVESISALRREQLDPELEDLTLELGGSMLELAGACASIAAGRERLDQVWRSGAALERFSALLAQQGADPGVVDHPDRLPRPERSLEVRTSSDGTFHGLRAREVGEWITECGGGRLVAGAAVDHRVGVELLARRGETVHAGDVVARLHGRADLSPESVGARAATWVDVRLEPISPLQEAVVDPDR
ncbi:MAG: thymidine phosphorylase [Candidatus Eisenbacteria bacterium]|nr:thymidine phosphorylase [Candidatus Eisenbacteria bacterium]